MTHEGWYVIKQKKNEAETKCLDLLIDFNGMSIYQGLF